MSKTSIEWVRNPDGSQGFTLNSKTGCTNHTPEGLCLGGLFPCYAYKLANGRLKQRYLANSNWVHWEPPENGYYDPFYPRWWPERLDKIRKLKKPTGIFLDDMSDWMGDYWPKEWTQAELQMMRENPQHRFYTLTKQPQRLPEFSPFPENCWVGVTVCNDKMLNVAVDKLEDIQASVKYISFEPLLERLTLSLDYAFYYSGINWLIIGACTGTYAEMWSLGGLTSRIEPYGNRCTLQPKIEWVKEIVEAADKAGIKVFLKDNLRPMLTSEANGKVFIESHNLWAFREFKLRQELPNV